MEFGVCLNVVELLREDPGKLDEQLTAVAAAGFSFLEINVIPCADADESELSAVKAALLKNKLVTKRAFILFPGDMKVVGPEKNENTIRDYLQNVTAKLKALGVDVIVFGSGGARQIPDGFPYDEAFTQFCDTARLAAELASVQGIKIALEHLNPKDCNLLVTVEETIKAIREVNHPNLGLTFDIYHIDDTGDDIKNVVKAKDVLFHSHTAIPVSRLYPTPEDMDSLREYFAILKSAGYDGTVSIEGNLHCCKSFEQNMTDAYKALSQYITLP